MQLPEKMSAKEFRMYLKTGIIQPGKKGKLKTTNTGLEEQVLEVAKKAERLSEPVPTIEEPRQIIFPIDPVPYLRVTQRTLFLLQKEPHEWALKMQPKARAIHRYFNYKSAIRNYAESINLTEIPTSIDSIKFVVPMTKSWSKKKLIERNGQLHTQRPDLDNYLKALFDAIHTEDSHIAEIRNGLSKVWGYVGKIIIQL